jgi:K+-sensing histidine kinase KdpD
MSDLTLEAVKQRVEAVLELDRRDTDPEQAHGAQDSLYVDILRAVTDSHPESVQMVREALRLTEGAPTRWYA